ncbi:T9SS type A sorting domain-containing protein [bacterium]|nr:T9SS type A sorting domain-containing protein [bacterium]
MNMQTAITFVPVNPGDYQLRIRTYCGQTLLSNIIHIGEDFQPVRLFPNPATNFITLNAPTQSPVKAVIYNMQGKQMVKLSFIGSKETATDYWPSGTYIVFVEYEGRQYTHKFVKN